MRLNCGPQQTVGVVVDKRYDRQAVLYVLPKADFFSEGTRGRVTHAMGIARGLAQNDVPVHMISGVGLAEYGKDLGPSVRFHELPARKVRPFSDLRWTFSLVSRMEKLLRNDSSIRFVIVRYASSNGFMFYRVARRWPHVVWVFEVNSLLYHHYYRLPKALRKFALISEGMIVNRGDFIYVVSEQLGTDLLSARFIGRERIIVVPNAGSEEVTTLAAAVAKDRLEDRSKENHHRFAYLGVFQTYYDLELLVDSFSEIQARHPQVHLHFFGDGPLFPRVRCAVEGNSSVTLHGRYCLEKIIKEGLIGENWILILPYRDLPICNIGSPTKLFEYMALGRAIIASRVGQLCEILQDGTTALLYRAGDRASLVACMQRMIDQPELRRAIMGNLRQEFLAKHTWQKRMRMFYETLLDEGRA